MQQHCYWLVSAVLSSVWPRIVPGMRNIVLAGLDLHLVDLAASCQC